MTPYALSIHKLTCFYFRYEASLHDEMVGRTLTWQEARQLWRKARIEALRLAALPPPISPHGQQE